MIVRFGGGNAGIGEYLEKGRKADRDYSREQLDHRLILDGDLSLTEDIYNSIEDKGQDRYLHITLSFHESEISEDTLKSVTQEYKSLLMNAFHEDEYSFYAEAHLPKLSHMADNRTGELIERKPHIHIVIPRTNLITDKSLNPIGDATNKLTQERLDAIQEHINKKFDLASPKDGIRVSDGNHASVLSRAKGDIFREKNGQFKNDILKEIDQRDIKSFTNFKKLLAEFGEVKTRNEGKPSEYMAVKLPGDNKFTNLKNPVFSKIYVEQRRLPLVKPTDTQIKSRLESWINQGSHEIKHVYSKGEKLREHYKALDPKSKMVFLQERISDYDRQNKLNSDHSSRTSGRQRSTEPGFNPNSRVSRASAGIGLPRLPSRSLVYGIPGRGEARDSERILSDNEIRVMAESRKERSGISDAMRWSGREGRRLGETSIASSSLTTDILLRRLDKDAEKNDTQLFAVIKKEIDPNRFLSYLKDKYNIEPSKHKVSFAADGSPRFRTEKRNMNASDFLTKKMNLSWNEAKIVLTDVYNQQLKDLPYKAISNPLSQLSDSEASKRRDSVLSSRNEIRAWVRSERSELFSHIKELRSQLKDIPKSQRSLAEGVIVYTKLTGLEKIKEVEKEARNTISQHHSHWHERRNDMQALAKLKQALSPEEENGIQSDDPRHNLKQAVDSQLRVNDMRNENQQLKDLVMDKGRLGVDYRDINTKEVVFSDKGNHVLAGKNPSNKEIGLMLEYAKEKYGGVLKLTGSDDFKSRCANAAAEMGMNVILKPEKYHDQMINIRQEINLSKENALQSTTLEKTSPVAESNENGAKEVSKEQLQAIVESLPERVTPSQLKTALAGFSVAEAASTDTDPTAVELDQSPQKAPSETVGRDGQEIDRLQIQRAIEQLPDTVTPSQLRDAVESVTGISAEAEGKHSAAESLQEIKQIAPELITAVNASILAEDALPGSAGVLQDADTNKYNVLVATDGGNEVSQIGSVDTLEQAERVATLINNQEPATLAVEFSNEIALQNAAVSMQEIKQIAPELITDVNASILAEDALPGSAGVLQDTETNKYDVLVAVDGGNDVFQIGSVDTREQAERLATLINNQEPASLAAEFRNEIDEQNLVQTQASAAAIVPLTIQDAKQEFALSSLQVIKTIDPGFATEKNAQVLADAIPNFGGAGVAHEIETDTYSVLLSVKGEDAIAYLADFDSRDDANRLAELVNKHEPAVLASAIQMDLSHQNDLTNNLEKSGLSESEAGAIAGVIKIQDNYPDTKITSDALRGIEAGSFAVRIEDSSDPFSACQIIGSNSSSSQDVEVAVVYGTEEAKALTHELNGLNTVALSSAVDKQLSVEAMNGQQVSSMVAELSSKSAEAGQSFDKLKNGIREAEFADELPDDAGEGKVQYTEISPNTWDIEVVDSSGEGHKLIAGIKGNEDYARLVMDKVTRIDLAALGQELKHRADEQHSTAEHQDKIRAELENLPDTVSPSQLRDAVERGSEGDQNEQEEQKPKDFGME